MSKTAASLDVRFWPKVNKQGVGGCWEWTAHCLPIGYGWFYVHRGLSRTAHRVSAVLHGLLDSLDSNLHVLHSCDNPKCVNPAHLFIGTNADNVADRVAKGRSGGKPQFGAANGMSKLVASQILFIRELYASGKFSQSQISCVFGVGQPTIHKIVNGQRWETQF
jgi:hypothetical protein